MEKLKKNKIIIIIVIIFFIYNIAWNLYASICYKQYAKESDGYVYQQNNQYVKYVGKEHSDDRYMFFVQSPKYLRFYGGTLRVKNDIGEKNELYADMEIDQSGEKDKMIVRICRDHFKVTNGTQIETTEYVARFELDANMEFYIGANTLEEGMQFEQYRYLIERIYIAEHEEWGFCNIDNLKSDEK